MSIISCLIVKYRYLACKEKRKGCSGRGKLKNDRFRQTKRHDRPPDNHAEGIRSFKESLKQKVQNNFQDIKDIYDEVSKE